MKSAVVDPHSTSAAEWDVGLHRSFQCAGRTVLVSLDAMRDAQGAVSFTVQWLPDNPKRLTPPDLAAFDEGKRIAEGLIRAHLAAQGRGWPP